MGINVDSKDFGRVAAQTAKQVIIQRVREAERTTTFDEYKERKGELVTAIGRKVQNVRLAAQLSGWRIDITSETKVSEEPAIA